jgi:hypothetical protein
VSPDVVDLGYQRSGSRARGKQAASKGDCAYGWLAITPTVRRGATLATTRRVLLVEAHVCPDFVSVRHLTRRLR